MMLKDDYRKLFDSISPSPALEQQTQREVIDMLQPKTKKNLRRTTCIAVAAIMLTFSVAFAAVQASGILNRLFRGEEPSQTAIESIVRDSDHVSVDGLSVNVDEYLFDHNTLHLGWTVSSERENPVFYTTTYDFIYNDPADEIIAEESIGGYYGAHSSEEVGDGVMVRLSKERPEYSGYASYAYNSGLNSAVTARVTVHFYETDWEEIDLPIDFYWDLVEDEALNKELETKRQIGLTDKQQTGIQSYAAYAEALNRLMDSGMEFEAADEAAIAESGIFKEVTTLEVQVNVDPSLASDLRFGLENELRYDLSDASVIMKTLSIDTASTIVEYEVITDKVFNEDGIMGNGITYILFDQDGNPLNSRYSLSMTARQLDDRDGKHVYFVSHSGNPISESVTAITFVPTTNLQRGEESSDAYFQRMKESANEEQCFTVEIK